MKRSGRDHLTNTEELRIYRAMDLEGVDVGDVTAHNLLSEFGRIVRGRESEAWEEGYESRERDERRMKECPGSSGCDCNVLTMNPFEEDV